MKYVGLSVDDTFLSALDLAVIAHRRENPERNATRSSFMKAALERAIEDSGVSLAPKPRVRRREPVRSSVAA